MPTLSPAALPLLSGANIKNQMTLLLGVITKSVCSLWGLLCSMGFILGVIFLASALFSVLCISLMP